MLFAIHFASSGYSTASLEKSRLASMSSALIIFAVVPKLGSIFPRSNWPIELVVICNPAILPWRYALCRLPQGVIDIALYAAIGQRLLQDSAAFVIIIACDGICRICLALEPANAIIAVLIGAIQERVSTPKKGRSRKCRSTATPQARAAKTSCRRDSPKNMVSVYSRISLLILTSN